MERTILACESFARKRATTSDANGKISEKPDSPRRMLLVQMRHLTNVGDSLMSAQTDVERAFDLKDTF